MTTGITRIEQTNVPVPLMAHAVIAGGLAHMCFTPWTPVSTLEEQVAEVFARLDSYLAKSGTSRSKLLVATVWLRNKEDYEPFVEMWNAWVDPESPPVFTFSEARLGRDTVLVEVKVIAAAG